MRDIKTDKYHLAVGTGQGKGTFIIIRKSDDKTTLRNVCSEGEGFYRQLQRAYKQSPAAFDALCGKEEYSA